MKKIIRLKNEEAKKNIEKIFSVGKSAISQALTFSRNGDKDVKIRIAAMKNGGKLFQEVTDWNYEFLK